MKMMTLEVDKFSRFKEAETIVCNLGVAATRAEPVWLPVPPVARTAQVVKRCKTPATKAIVRSIWIAPERETLGEKLMLTMLVFAAVAGVGYGFSSLVDLVQNWGAFNGWVGQIVR